MKKILTLSIIAWLLVTSWVYAINSNEIMSANNLALKWIIKSHSENTNLYNLNSPVLRQEIALISRRVSGVLENSSCKNTFADITSKKPNNWVCTNVEALVENKLISKNRFFNPERNISKSEALIMFIKSIWFPEFEIKDPKNWQKEVVDFAVKNEVVERFTDYNKDAKRGWIFKIADYSIKVKEKRVKAWTWKKRKKYSDEVSINEDMWFDITEILNMTN